jgi:hypothetical protein
MTVERVELNSEQTGSEAPTQEEGQQEQLLAGKFKSVEDLEKSYLELQTKMGQAPKPEAKEDEGGSEGEAEAAEKAAEKATEEAKETVEKAGLNFDEFTQEYAQNGKLSDESLTKLQEAGVSKSIVDSYIAGQQALANQIETEIYESVGGREGYEQMLSWAKGNLSTEEAQAFNDALDGSVAQAKLAIQGLHARYQSAEGREAKLLGGKAGANSGDVFRSRSELVKAMSDPRYSSDPAFRQDVQDKLARSDIL